MAFTSKIKSSLSSFSLGREEITSATKTESLDEIDSIIVSPKLTRSELNKLTKSYPSWLRDNSAVKNLPAIYKGVLGQVQSHPTMNLEGNQLSKFERLTTQNNDYLNRFTDTQRVQQLLLASQLSNELLAIIWAYVNKSFPGKLTNREVCLALALIAIFQKCETDAERKELLFGPTKKDLFQLVKAESKAPIPKLYPTNSKVGNSNTHNQSYLIDNEKSEAQASSTNDFGLLVDLTSDAYEKLNLNSQSPFNVPMVGSPDNFHQDSQITSTKDVTFVNRDWLKQFESNDLMDPKTVGFEKKLVRSCEVWSDILIAIRLIMKKSFDILSVNHARQSAVESLTSTEGKSFIKQISLLYPLAHNIKLIISYVDKLGQCQIDEMVSEKTGATETKHLLDKSFLKFTEDLMTSINEYWAVLINLFHECGQTNYIEYIMDGLNKPTTIDIDCQYKLEDIALKLDTRDKTDKCSICQTNEFILTKYQILARGIEQDNSPLTTDELDLLTNNELITNDEYYYYHVKCGNFWLNNVGNDNRLPFEFLDQNVNILLPTKCDQNKLSNFL